MARMSLQSSSTKDDNNQGGYKVMALESAMLLPNFLSYFLIFASCGNKTHLQVEFSYRYLLLQ
jgi:hypothetical protein